MGAWGYKAFENDDAADFVRELEDASGTDILLLALSKITEENDYLELREAARSVVAAEVIAAIRDNESGDLPDSIWDYVQSQDHVETELIGEAIRSMRRVLRDSEMMALWEDSKYAADWKNCMHGLIGRLDS